VELLNAFDGGLNGGLGSFSLGSLGREGVFISITILL
jgi:hypothetical protein